MSNDVRDLATIATFYRRVQWAALALGVLWVVWLLAPILSPFVFAALLGWLGDPLVDRIQRSGRSRPLAVTLVYALMLVLLPVSVTSILTLGSAMPMPMSAFAL